MGTVTNDPAEAQRLVSRESLGKFGFLGRRARAYRTCRESQRPFCFLLRHGKATGTLLKRRERKAILFKV